MGKQTLTRTAKGLYSQFNPFEAPEGALLEAENVVCDREGVVGKRRGFNRYAALGGVASALMEYQGRIVALEGSTLRYDSDGAGTMASYSGSFSPPSAGDRMRAATARGNLYLTSSAGIQKTDALTTTPVRAGIPRPPDLDLTLSGTGGGFFTFDTQVGYRILFGRTDAQMLLLLGAPSIQQTLANPVVEATATASGTAVTVASTAHGLTTGDEITVTTADDTDYTGTFTITVSDVDTFTYTALNAPADTGPVDLTWGKSRDVSLTATIPDDVVAGDFYEVYRTNLSAAANVTPGLEHFKLKRVEITAADITAGTVSFSDTFDSIFLGEKLYTNPTSEGELKRNLRPPYAHDVAEWRGHLFFANTFKEHFLEVAIVAFSSLQNDDTITLTLGGTTRTYTAKAAEAIGSQEFLLSSAAATTAENIELTAESLVRVVNRDAGQSTWYAEYTSFFEDPPGKILFYTRDLGTDPFSVTSSAGDAFEPEIPSSGTALTSDDDAAVNRLYRSKFERPEAVPTFDFDDIGAKDKAILRIVPLRNALIILKEDGIWKITGQQEVNFVVREVDLTVFLLARETAVALNDYVYGLTNQGVVRANEFGVAIVSRPDERDIHKLFSFSSFQTRTHAAAYESDRKYLLFAQEDSSDSETEIAWVYNYITNAWARWRKHVRAARVISSTDRLYLAHADDAFILEERKSFNVSADDFRDEDIPVTVTAIGTTTFDGQTVTTVDVTYTYSAAELTAGFLFEQGNTESDVLAVTALGGTSYRLTLSEDIPGGLITTGAAVVSLPIASRVRWKPDHAGNASMQKQFTGVSLYFERNGCYNFSLGCRGDRAPLETLLALRVQPVTGWGMAPWGVAPWGDTVPAAVPARIRVPLGHQRGRTLAVVFEHNYAKEGFEILQVAIDYRPYSTVAVRTKAGIA